MLTLDLARLVRRGTRLLCVGAHPDDIEIGCGGTLLRLLDRVQDLAVTWVVLSGDADRSREARRSAEVLLRPVRRKAVLIKAVRDGFFPQAATELKECFEDLKRSGTPDLIFTHRRADLHQDHRLVAELTWQTFRDHLILEYEIPKYEGDLGAPNVFVHLDAAAARRKLRHILRTFGSQRERRWFREEVFLALLRLRGVECNAPDGLAEAFHGGKIVLG